MKKIKSFELLNRMSGKEGIRYYWKTQNDNWTINKQKWKSKKGIKLGDTSAGFPSLMCGTEKRCHDSLLVQV